jgi:zinc transporter, ZIP family
VGAEEARGLWLLIVLACGVAAALGFLATDATSAAVGDRAAALAAGGLLAMLTNSLMPFAFERGKSLAGAATVVGFCLTMLNT